jgi:hypothetical protein
MTNTAIRTRFIPIEKGQLAFIDDYQPIDSNFVAKDDCNCTCDGCDQGGDLETDPTTKHGAARTTAKIAPNIALSYSGDRSSTQRFHLKTFTPYFQLNPNEKLLVESTLYINSDLVETLYFDYRVADLFCRRGLTGLTPICRHDDRFFVRCSVLCGFSKKRYRGLDRQI